MLAQKNRLKKDKDFKRVFKEGRRLVQDFLLFSYLKNDLEYSRVGIVISSKVVKKATARNLLKRRIREAVRPLLDNNKTHFDIVILVKSGVKNDFKTIKREIEKALGQIIL